VLFFVFVLCAIGLNGLTESWTLWRHGEKVSATITDSEAFEDGILYEVEYDEIQASAGGLGNDHKIGDVVDVLVDPANPTEVKSKSDLVSGLIVGLLFLAAGAAVAIYGLRRKTSEPAPTRA
jgi:hypothetical protein